VSTTVTVKEQVAVLPAASVATAVTVVTPFGNTDPDAGVAPTTTPGQLSVAITLKLTVAEHWPAAAGAVMFAGQAIIGGCVSVIVTVKLQPD
jgi:hypothetical protein